MSKKGFKHKCQMSFGNDVEKRKTCNGKSSKSKSTDKGSITEIYNRYYRNQVAALYNAVNGNQ